MTTTSLRVMLSLTSLVLALAAAGIAQTAKTGSISGIVRDADTGVLAQNAAVHASGPCTACDAKTDRDGRFTLSGMLSGRYDLVVADFTGRTVGGIPPKTVTVKPGQDVTSVSLALLRPATISGKVLDGNRDPQPGVTVVLRRKVYRTGLVRYLPASAPGATVAAQVTDLQGNFQFSGIPPVNSYVLEVFQGGSRIDDAEVSADPNQREPEVPVTYYPGTTSLQDAETLVPRSGEWRSNADVRVSKTVTYCIDGTIQADPRPERLQFTVLQEQPLGVAATPVAGGNAPDDGKFRVCHLLPAIYHVTAVRTLDGRETTQGATRVVTVHHNDEHDVRLMVQPLADITIQAERDSPPDPPVSTPMKVILTGDPMAGSIEPSITIGEPAHQVSIPAADYLVGVTGLPKGYYLRELTIAGVSALRNPVLSYNAVFNGALVRLVVSNDGGVIGGSVVDLDGNPVGGSRVCIFPKDASTPAELSVSMVTLTADQNGQFLSPTLAPGRYLVLATETPIVSTPEFMARLWRARLAAQEVEVRPNGASQATLASVAVP